MALEHGLGGQAAVADILKHVRISMPDAVIGLDAGKEVPGNLARAKLREVALGAVGIQKLEVALREINARRGCGPRQIPEGNRGDGDRSETAARSDRSL